MTDLADEFPIGDYPDGWCFFHKRAHQQTSEWDEQCRGVADLDFDQRYLLFQQAHAAGEQENRRRWAWLKRATVCWWKHRTRKVTDGVYLSHPCWACTGGR